MMKRPLMPNCGHLIKWAAALVFIVPLLPANHRTIRRLVAVVLSLSQVYVVCVHTYLMATYWSRTIDSKGGLTMELLLYVSAALTFPTMQYYIDCWNFSVWRRRSGKDAESDFQKFLFRSCQDFRGLGEGSTKHWLGSVSGGKVFFSRVDAESVQNAEKGVVGAIRPHRHRHSRIEQSLIFLTGYALVIAYVLFDLISERVFDEKNIRMFMKLYKLSEAEVVAYWLYVFLVFWGMFSSITTCCIFHILCSEQREAIDESISVLQECCDREEGRKIVNNLAQYLRQRRAVMQGWFFIHTLLFGVLLMTMLYFTTHLSARLGVGRAKHSVAGFSPWPVTSHHEATYNTTDFLPNKTELGNSVNGSALLVNTSMVKATAGDSPCCWLFWCYTTDTILTSLSKFVSISILVFKFSYPFIQAANVPHHWQYVKRNLDLGCKQLSLIDKNAIVQHWENCTSGYMIGHVMLTGTSIVVPFAMSALLVFMQAQ